MNIQVDGHANVDKAEQEPGLILSSRRNAARIAGEKPCGSFGGFWGVRRAVLKAVKSVQALQKRFANGAEGSAKAGKDRKSVV